ncbi:D-glucuronate isomerase [Aquimarina amphilecti]|uniref:Uronate isomerase n=1 Tax=Aquimarina amphilecti TaxID=1038014 RepID=A0A1H7NPL0_AQUAM|nr:glucuronate isomerase [Aquimarina amphilecti]SEL25480.1 D-glucuronate isomerase [Aquimarina amphilecti]
MKATSSFIHNDFLLQNDFSKILYHSYAKDLPIIDYHNHLSPKDVCDNRKFNTITEVWLQGDHYKWRAMRTLGINEKFITGKATDNEKFLKWADTVPYTIRNPLFHWTHMELMKHFSISEILSPETAKKIYSSTNEQLQSLNHTTQGLLKMNNVTLVCTTDDPIDSLKNHSRYAAKEKEMKLLPTFRPDNSYAIGNSSNYLEYLNQLEAKSNIQIKNFEDLLAALENRIDYFHETGCRLSDHGLENLYYFQKGTCNIEQIFKKIKAQRPLEIKEINYFKFEVLHFLSTCYHKRGWVQQYHLGAIRNNNKRLLKKLGPDTGFDSIGDYSQAKNLSRFLNSLDKTDQLAKTILYNLNPSDNEVFASMVGNFNDGSVKGKIQYGAAWWFLDQKDGMEKHLNSLSNIGILSCFVGMLTDSRSFLSFPRHDYFRRILCNLIGDDVKNGILPRDEKWLGKIVSDICYHNAKAYFPF